MTGETDERHHDIYWEVYGGRGLWFRVRVTPARPPSDAGRVVTAARSARPANQGDHDE